MVLTTIRIQQVLFIIFAVCSVVGIVHTAQINHTFVLGDQDFVLDGKPFAAIAELDLTFPDGKNVSHANWTIVYVDSEEVTAEDGSAMNAINGQTSDMWHTQWQDAQPKHPHYLIIDLGDTRTVGGFRYTPRSGCDVIPGRIKDYRIYVGDASAK